MATRTRNSVYLDGKAMNLQAALAFFLDSGPGQSRSDRLLTFLDQIDFWDWEIEELYFSFQNFKERAEAFDTTTPGERAGTQGIMIKPSKAQDLQYKRRYTASLERTYGGQRATGRIPVVAPKDALEAVLATWHEVLTAAENSVMAAPSVIEHAERAGVTSYQKDLSRFRKVDR